MREHRRSLCGNPFVRVLVVLLILVGQCPSFAAGLVMAASTGSDHAVSCSLGSTSIEVVLAHSHDPASPHHHTLAEQLILRTGTNDQDHPDHRFRFARETSIAPSGDVQVPEATCISPVASFVDLSRGLWRTIASDPTAIPPPPGVTSTTALLRGVVMRH